MRCRPGAATATRNGASAPPWRLFRETAAGTLLHIGATEADLDLYEHTPLEEVICIHHSTDMLEKIRRFAPATPRVIPMHIDLSRVDAMPRFLGAVATRNLTCVMWRFSVVGDLRGAVQALLSGVRDSCYVYVLMTDAWYAQQMICQGVMEASAHTLFLPDGERRPIPQYDVSQVQDAFCECGYRCVYRETAGGLVDRLGSNMLPNDRVCSDIQVLLAFAPPYRCCKRTGGHSTAHVIRRSGVTT